MSKRIVSITTLTPTATADTTNLANTTYPFILQGGTTTQINNVMEVYLGGQATSSAPTYMVAAMDSTAAATNTYGTGQTDAPMNAAAAALAAPALTGNTNATAPKRSSTLHLLNLSFNAFGGIVKWTAAPGEEMIVVGNAASTGELSVSAFTGGTAGLMGAHMIYEPV